MLHEGNPVGKVLEPERPNSGHVREVVQSYKPASSTAEEGRGNTCLVKLVFTASVLSAKCLDRIKTAQVIRCW